MKQVITTVGLDPANSVFQVHGINADGEVLVRRQLRRAEVLRFFSLLPPCRVGMEACASAHHWGRELLALGHDVRLMLPAYVRHMLSAGSHRVLVAQHMLLGRKATF
jgi:transposase